MTSTNLSLTQRRRAMTGLFSAVALAATGYIPAVSVAPLVAEDLMGSAHWSGLPGAVTVLGMALGAGLLTRAMEWRGRRFGLMLGFAVATLAILAGATAVETGAFGLFLATLFVFGGGYGSRHLARYAAGDLYSSRHRGTAISVIVWAGTIGSVGGPLLLEPSQGLALRLGLRGLVGPYLLAAVASALAFTLLRLLVPSLPSTVGPVSADSPSTASLPLPQKRQLLRPARVRFALVAMMFGQFVMVLIMSMTPIHIRHAGESLSVVGLVFSAHTLGMFALSPLTGWLSDRWGRVPVILTGETMVLASALLAAPAAGDDRVRLVISLFLLGLGWNFGFVAGSALLSESVSEDQRLRIQGLADTIVWTSAAAASLLAGVLLAVTGYRGLSLIGGVAILIPPMVYARLRVAMQGERSASLSEA
ncbi:MAG: MFS transporter [Thermoanaerobaculia bacterium]|nr:MFS transporter [Thermoanaerobaculia bacterium]